MATPLSIRILCLCLFLLSPGWAQVEDVTTVYVVRHAEKQQGSDDPSLTAQGHYRALELAQLLHPVPLVAIYSTDTSRTLETVKPVARQSGLEIRPYPGELSLEQWAQGLAARHRGGAVLVVGHSNTVPSIAKALSGQAVSPIEHHDHDNLFEVTILHSSRGDQVRMVRHQFGTVRPLGPVAFPELFEGKDVSAVARHGDFLVLGTDEQDSIQILQKSAGGYKALAPHSLNNQGELDIEGLAREGNTYYVAGSHSARRKKVSTRQAKTLNRSYLENRARLSGEGIKAEDPRDRIYRMTLVPGRAPEDVSFINIRPLLQQNSVLSPYLNLPSKENGVDVEGLAVDSGRLVLGFRGPVLRGGFNPVLKLKFEEPDKAETVFVQLGGRGVRDIVRVQDGFLIVAGPVGDSDLSYRLYHWNGHDCVPGQGGPAKGVMTLLGTLPTGRGGKPEGLAVLSQDDSHYELLLLYDGLSRGGPQRLKVRKP